MEGVWHPIIDEDKCTNCDFCYEFCPKGVYIKDNEKVVVENPSSCVDGCHGCEWQCQSGAIRFPEPITKEYVTKVIRWSKKKNKKVSSEFLDYALKNHIIEECEINREIKA
ncbi:MAG: ferredoxin family protein [Firmicutes bacterium]|nr:ferredoxin family protein [Bacillota bacterium]